MNARKAVIEITVITLILSAGAFICKGGYDLYKVKRNTDVLQVQTENLTTLQNKYCDKDRPTPEEQKMCIDLLKASVVKKK